HFRSSKQSLEFDPVKLKGANTNFEMAGSMRFAGNRALSMRLNGTLDLRLLTGYFPDMDIRGPALINTSFEGTLDRPRITGKVHIDNASARSTDFPTGLSALKGDIIFDATRAFFSDMTAEAGGGSLHLSGGMNYSEAALRYDVSVRSDRMRIRY